MTGFSSARSRATSCGNAKAVEAARTRPAARIRLSSLSLARWTTLTKAARATLHIIGLAL